MITSALLIALLFCVIAQPTVVRGYVAILFVIVTMLHELVGVRLDGLAYYGSAALCDLAIIVLTSGLRPVPAMVSRIHLICLASIIVNAVGWAMWAAYLPPTVYDAAFVLIYLVAVVAMLKKDSSDVMGGHTPGGRRTRIRGGLSARYHTYIKKSG